MIRFECPQCRQSVEVDDEFAGRRGRCPGCQSVIDIPGAAVAAAPQPQGPPGGPRKLTIPESVRSVVPARSEPEGSGLVPSDDDSGRALAIAGLVLGCVPLLSVLGIFVGGAGWSQAARSSSRQTRRLAMAATWLSVAMTAASLVVGFMAIVSLFQEMAGSRGREACLRQLSAVGRELEQYASDHGGAFPESVSELSSHYYSGRCPESERRYTYVAGLKADPAAATIILYDPAPAHAVRTWLWRSPAGRNVYRLDGTAEFLEEADFRREVSEVQERIHRSGG